MRPMSQMGPPYTYPGQRSSACWTVSPASGS